MKLEDINITEISNNCITLTFNNINHLVDIFGKNDENLNVIEKQLSIEIKYKYLVIPGQL
jgi:phosphate starvation-inducible protein PhoH